MRLKLKKWKKLEGKIFRLSSANFTPLYKGDILRIVEILSGRSAAKMKKTAKKGHFSEGRKSTIFKNSAGQWDIKKNLATPEACQNQKFDKKKLHAKKNVRVMG